MSRCAGPIFRPASLFLLTACLFACGRGMMSRPAALSPVAAQALHLRVDGRVFRTTGSRRFDWRGLTSFRLLEMVAHERAPEAETTLVWAAEQGLTVVRVLAMADILFKLSPADGRAALPDLLSLAQRRGLVVEVVALADSGRMGVDLREQVRAVGEICAKHPNCVVEIANEPWTSSQRQGLGDAGTLGALRALVPRSIPVSLGSAQVDDSAAYAAGDYLTVHLDRRNGREPWRHVLRMAAAGRLSARTGKPVVDDEPIGAAGASVSGRRDASTARWFAKGILSRVLDLPGTFHFEGGLQGKVPEGHEAACFQAWRRGLETLPPGLEEQTSFREPGTAGAAVAAFDRRHAEALYLAQGEREAWAVAVGATGDPGVRWQAGWRSEESRSYEGVWVVRGVRTGTENWESRESTVPDLSGPAAASVPGSWVAPRQ